MKKMATQTKINKQQVWKIYKYAPYVAPWRYIELCAAKDVLSRNNIDEENVLDLGCGSGELTGVIFDAVAAGIDLQYTEIQKARKHAEYKELFVADATKIGVKKEKFDLLFSNSVVEHIPDQENLWREITRVVKKKGFIIVTVPTTHFIPYSFFLVKKVFPNKCQEWERRINKSIKHYHYFNLERFQNIARENELSVVDYQCYGGKWLTAVTNIFLRTYQLRIGKTEAGFKIHKILAAVMRPILYFMTKYQRRKEGSGLAILLRRE